jgi:hypothetical protein
MNASQSPSKPPIKSFFKSTGRTTASAAFCICVLATFATACVQTQSSTQSSRAASDAAAPSKLQIVKAEPITVLGSRSKPVQAAAAIVAIPASDAVQGSTEVAAQARVKSMFLANPLTN